MQKFFEEMYSTLGAYLPLLVGALAILLAGWIIAFMLSATVQKLLSSSKVNKLLLDLSNNKNQSSDFRVDKVVSKAVYYLVMVFVVIAIFQTLGLTIITEPLNLMLAQIFEFIPNLLGAAILLLTAWIFASILKMIVSKALGSTNLDERLSKQAGLKDSQQIPVSTTLSNASYWLVFLLFLPAIIGSLGMQGLLKPMQGMMESLLVFLPNLIGASLILAIGWFVARIISQIVANLLLATGIDQLGIRIGIGINDSPTLSKLLGIITYAFILIPTIIAGLNALKVEALSKPATEMLNTFMQAVPAIFGAVVVLAIAYFIGKIITSLIANILTGIGFNKVTSLIGLKSQEYPNQKTPSEVVGYIAFIVLMLFATIEAANLMNFTTLSELIASFMTFGGQVLLGVAVLGLGLYFANIVHKIILNTAGHQASLLSQVARLSIIILSAAMGLQQMGIANDIINLAFGLLLGAIAIAVAISFGLGGREIAAREIENCLNSLRSKTSEKESTSKELPTF